MSMYVFSSSHGDSVATARCAVSCSLEEQLDRLSPLMTSMLTGRGVYADMGLDDESETVLLHVHAQSIKLFGAGTRVVQLVPDRENGSVSAHALFEALVNSLTPAQRARMLDCDDVIVRVEPCNTLDPDEFRVVLLHILVHVR